MGNIISWRLTREIAEDKIAYYENMLENLMPAIDLGKDKKMEHGYLMPSLMPLRNQKRILLHVLGLLIALLV